MEETVPVSFPSFLTRQKAQGREGVQGRDGVQSPRMSGTETTTLGFVLRTLSGAGKREVDVHEGAADYELCDLGCSASE